MGIWESENSGVNPSLIDHNLLANLQGGVSGEYYHLSAAQYAKLQQGNYQADWNASTNTPSIPTATLLNKDQFYKVVVAGTTTIDGISVWNEGDWIWSDGTKWIKLATADNKVAANTTKILIIADIAANTPISLTTSGVGYTKSGDNGNVGSTSTIFLNTPHMVIYRNGQYLEKGSAVNYVSSTSISLPYILRATEKLVILT